VASGMLDPNHLALSKFISGKKSPTLLSFR